MPHDVETSIPAPKPVGEATPRQILLRRAAGYLELGELLVEPDRETPAPARRLLERALDELRQLPEEMRSGPLASLIEGEALRALGSWQAALGPLQVDYPVHIRNRGLEHLQPAGRHVPGGAAAIPILGEADGAAGLRHPPPGRRRLPAGRGNGAGVGPVCGRGARIPTAHVADHPGGTTDAPDNPGVDSTT